MTPPSRRVEKKPPPSTILARTYIKAVVAAAAAAATVAAATPPLSTNSPRRHRPLNLSLFMYIYIRDRIFPKPPSIPVLHQCGYYNNNNTTTTRFTIICVRLCAFVFTNTITKHNYCAEFVYLLLAPTTTVFQLLFFLTLPVCHSFPPTVYYLFILLFGIRYRRII